MRTRFTSKALRRPAVLVFLLVATGCGDSKDADQTNMVTNGRQIENIPAPGGPSTGPGSPAEAGGSTSIKAIMTKLAKGPGSLTNVIGNELKAEPPPWETIQPQTAEFTRLATALGQNDPPKGTDESWAKLTTAYAEAASALDNAAKVKDRAAASTAHGKLAASCMECHREHRVMGPPGKGMGPGFGGPPPGGPPPGGPPPG